MSKQIGGINRRQLLVAGGLTTAALMSGQARSLVAARAPDRIIFVYTPGGAIPADWRPTACGKSMALPVASRPLEPVKHHCLFINNLTAMGPGHGLTATCLGLDFSRSTTTLDRILAARWKGQTPVDSLHLAAGPSIVETVSRQDEVEIPFLVQPKHAYDQLFPTPSKGDLSNPLHTPFQQDFESYAGNFSTTLDMQIQLAALALQQNQTRIVTLMMGDHQGSFIVPEIHTQDYHVAITAAATPAPYNGYRAFLSGKLAYLIKLLEATIDDTGRPLLDSTLVVQLADMGDARFHGAENAPYLLAGGKRYFKNGGVVQAGGAPHYSLLDAVGSAYGLETPYFSNSSSGLMNAIRNT